MVSKSLNEVLYAEAGADFVDFIFSILTLPLGSVIKILGGNTNMECIDNFYKSTDKIFTLHDALKTLLPKFFEEISLIEHEDASKTPDTDSCNQDFDIAVPEK
ncbi:hypothetical protein GIB67_010942, partial [Kingdonia uniflora]